MNQNSVNTSADLVVYGKIFTAENNQIVEAFAVKDGKYVYVGDKNGVEAFVEAGKTEIVDYTGKGLVMPSCGNGHAHYSIGVALPIVGTVAIGQTPDKFMNELVPAAVKKAREANATGIFGFLVNAGIMKADGTVLKKDKDIRGGEIVMGADGTPPSLPKLHRMTQGWLKSRFTNDSARST